MLSGTTFISKIESLQKRALRFVLNDYESPYQVLPENSSKSTMTLMHYMFFWIEVYKTLDNLNPSFMKGLLELKKTIRLVHEPYEMNLNILGTNQVTYGTKRLRIFGLKMLQHFTVPH